MQLSQFKIIVTGAAQGMGAHFARRLAEAGAQVAAGYGNNGEDGTEGAVAGNVYGTYLHGSLLPKNPAFADHLILLALRRRYGPDETLSPLDDSIEDHAHAAAARIARSDASMARGRRGLLARLVRR